MMMIARVKKEKEKKKQKEKGGGAGGRQRVCVRWSLGGVSQDYGVSKETEKLMNCQRSVREENSMVCEPV